MVGRTLAHYRILRSLGSGGMGEVWLAEDTRLDRKVALKILPSDVAEDPERLARFRREAKALAALSHPNIVTIYSVEEAEGISFLTMELVQGERLDGLIHGGGLSISQLFALAVPLADAVSAAHEQGIVHRDLKPANILVGRDGRPKVLDFGLAKIGGPRAGGGESQLSTAELTREGFLLGTVPYMSPEQVQGQPVNHRSDLFSLGVILYEMATGSRPFQGQGPADLVSSILRDTPPAVNELRGELPRHLGRIVRHCLEKDPERRYQSAKDLRTDLQDLERELTSEQLLARTPASARRLPGRLGWLIGGLLGTAALGLLLVVPSLQGPAGTEMAQEVVTPVAERKMLVVLPFENLGPTEDDYFAAGITEELTSRLAMVEGLGVISRTSAVQYDRTGKSMREIGEDFGVSYVLEGTVRWAREGQGPSRVRITPQLIRVADDTHLWADAYDRVIEDIFEVQSDIAENVTGELELALVGGGGPRARDETRITSNLDAYNAYLQGLYHRERADFGPEEQRRAVEALEEAVALDPRFALAHVQLARARFARYLFGTDRTAENATRGKLALDRAFELEPELPEVHLALGDYHYMVEQDYDAALAEYRVAARELPSSAESLFWIAMILRRQGQFEKSAATHEEALRLDPRSPLLVSQLSLTYSFMRRFDRALELAERTLALEPNHEGALTAMAGVHVVRSGDVEAARRVAERIPGVTVHKLYYQVMGDFIDGRAEDALARLEAFPENDFHYDSNFHGPKGIVRGWLLDHLARRDEARLA